MDDDIPEISLEDAQRLGAIPQQRQQEDEIPEISLEDAQRLGARPVEQDQERAPREQLPPPESQLGTAVREAAHAAIPTAGGVGAGAYGAAVGATVGGPVGAFIGGIVGGLGGYTLTDYVQNILAKKFGFDDEAQRQANQQENPITSAVAGYAPGAAFFGPGIEKLGVDLAKRAAVSGGILGGTNVAQQYAETGKVDPTQALIATGAGALMNRPTKLGARVMEATEPVGGKLGTETPTSETPMTATAEPQTNAPTDNIPTPERPEGTPNPTNVTVATTGGTPQTESGYTSKLAANAVDEAKAASNQESPTREQVPTTPEEVAAASVEPARVAGKKVLDNEDLAAKENAETPIPAPKNRGYAAVEPPPDQTKESPSGVNQPARDFGNKGGYAKQPPTAAAGRLNEIDTGQGAVDPSIRAAINEQEVSPTTMPSVEEQRASAGQPTAEAAIPQTKQAVPFEALERRLPPEPAPEAPMAFARGPAPSAELQKMIDRRAAWEKRTDLGEAEKAAGLKRIDDVIKIMSKRTKPVVQQQQQRVPPTEEPAGRSVVQALRDRGVPEEKLKGISDQQALNLLRATSQKVTGLGAKPQQASAAGGGKQPPGAPPPKAPGPPPPPGAATPPPTGPRSYTLLSRELLKHARRYFAPGFMSPAAERAQMQNRKAIGEFERFKAQSETLLEKAHSDVNRLSEEDQRKLTNYIQGGSHFPGYQPPPELKQIADVLRDRYDAMYGMATSTEKLENLPYFEHYAAGMYKNPKEALDFLKSWQPKGSMGSAKKKLFPTNEDAMAAGHEPASHNPVETYLRYQDGFGSAIARVKEFEAGRKSGDIKYFSERAVGASGSPTPATVGGPPDGWAPIKGPMGLKTTPAGTMRAYAPADYAAVINNFHGGGLSEHFPGVPEALRRMNNAFTGMELGLNVYHGFTMLGESFGTSVARSLTHFAAGDISKGVKAFAETPFAPVTYTKKGDRLFQIYNGKIKNPTAAEQHYMDIVTASDIKFGRKAAPDYDISKAKDYWTSYKNGDLWKTTVGELGRIFQEKDVPAGLLYPFRQVGRIMQTMAHPLFDYVIPRMKVGAHATLMQDWMEAHPTATFDEQVKASAIIGNSIDNRMGEMAMSHLYLDPIMRDVATIGLRSASWTIGGAFKEIGGGLLSGVKGLIKGQNRMSVASEHYDPRVSYAIGFAMTTAAMASIYQFLRTGKPPEDWRDFVDPQTGGTAPGVGGKGKVNERVMLPGYQKDILGYVFKPGEELKGKVSGFWTSLAEQAKSSDWKGDPIVPPKATYAEAIKARAEHFFGKMTPISFKNMLQQQKQGSHLSEVERFLGFRNPGQWIQDPEGVKRAQEKHDVKAWRKKEAFERRDALQRGEPVPERRPAMR